MAKLPSLVFTLVRAQADLCCALPLFIAARASRVPTREAQQSAFRAVDSIEPCLSYVSDIEGPAGHLAFRDRRFL
jgi:hypothetical protein